MMQEVQRNICFNLVLFLFGNQWYFFLEINGISFWKSMVFFLWVIEVLLKRKVHCVYDSKLIALEANTNKSKGRANRN